MTDFIFKEFEAIKSQYPGLKIDRPNNKIAGSIGLFDIDTGEMYDSYHVEIKFPETFPHCFPKVWEVGNKIPKEPNRHVNEDGSLCLGVIQEEILITRYGISLVNFLERVLKPHLSRETYFEKKRKYPHGEYSHGIDGVLEFFFDKFDTSDPVRIVQILDRIISGDLPDRNERQCICGSENKFKKCHLNDVEEVSILGKERLKMFSKIIKDHKKIQ